MATPDTTTHTLAYPTDVAALDFHSYDTDCVVQGLFDREYETDTIVEGPDRYDRRLMADPVIAESLPNVFYGIAEVADITVSLDNSDGELSFLHAEDPRARPIRLRHFDEDSGELFDVEAGVIQQPSVGDQVDLTISNRDLDVLNTPLPRHAINMAATTAQDAKLRFENEPNPNVMTSQFPRAVDVGAQINIIFGSTKGVKCAYANEDGIRQEYDYLVGEGKLDVKAIYKNGNISYTLSTDPRRTNPGITTIGDVDTSQTIGAVVESITPNPLPATQQGTTNADYKLRFIDPIPVGGLTARFQGFWIVFTTGALRGQYFRVTRHERTTDLYHVLTIIEDITAANSGDFFDAVEWIPLANTIYQGRTAIRFGRPQAVGGTLATITADVARYRTPRKNLLFETQGFDLRRGIPYPSRYWRRHGLSDASPFPGVSQTKAILPDGTVQITLTADPNVSPDGVSKVTRAAVDAGPGFIETVVPKPAVPPSLLANLQTFIFSIWIQAQQASTISLEVFGDGSPSAAVATYQAVATPTAGAPEIPIGGWARCEVKKVGGFGGSTQVYCRVNLPTANSVFWVWGAQLEAASPTTARATYYEPVGTLEQGAALWSFPDAIADVLSNSEWGLDQVIDVASFEQANTDLAVGITDTDWLFLKCQGSIPDLGGETRRAVDILNEMLMVRGMQLRKVGSCWKILVGCVGMVPQAIFGTIETPFANAFVTGSSTVAPAQKKHVTETVRSIKIGYAQELGLLGSGITPFFPFISSYIVDPNALNLERARKLAGHTFSKAQAALRRVEVVQVGQIDKLIPAVFIRDSNTADRFAQFLAAALVLSDVTVSLDTGNAARRLRAGMLVKLIAPLTQPENRLEWSEDFTQGRPFHTWSSAALYHPNDIVLYSGAAWIANAITMGTAPAGPSPSPWDLFTNAWLPFGGATFPGATVTGHKARDPFNRAWTATEISFSGGACGVKQTTTTPTIVDGQGQHAIASVWLKAATSGAHITLAVRAESGGQEGSTTVVLGVGYQRVRAECFFTPGAGGNVVVEIRQSDGPSTVYVWGAQLVLDYDKGYIKTDDYVWIPNQLHRIQSMTRNDVDGFTMALMPWDEERLYTYTKGSYPIRMKVAPPIDPRFSAPDVVDLENVSFPPTAKDSAAMGIDTRDGVSNVWAEISWIMPRQNVAKVRVQIRKTNDIFWTDLTEITTQHVPDVLISNSEGIFVTTPHDAPGKPGGTSLGTLAGIRINGLLTNQSYDIAFISVTNYGVEAFADQEEAFTTPSSPPATP